jgi:hypothetical protein
MRLPRVRFTVRRLMIMSAVVAVSFAAWIETKRRSVEYEIRAMDHALKASVYKGNSTRPDTWVHLELDRPPPPPDPAMLAYHAAMASKWSDAASRPWLPVEPDPPEPK